MAGTRKVSASNTITVLAPTGILPSANNIDITPGGRVTLALYCQDSAGTSCIIPATISGLPTGLSVSPSPPWQITSQGVALRFHGIHFAGTRRLPSHNHGHELAPTLPRSLSTST